MCLMNHKTHAHKPRFQYSNPMAQNKTYRQFYFSLLSRQDFAKHTHKIYLRHQLLLQPLQYLEQQIVHLSF